MDSITQITLGAAVGEVVLGKKIGNRAMLWGALAGTIPDLDVFANFVTDEIGALAFHRSITHSIAFAVVAPIVLGWLVHQLYDVEQRNWKKLLTSWGIAAFSIFWLTSLGANVLPVINFADTILLGIVIAASVMFIPMIVLLKEQWRKKPLPFTNPPAKSWMWLFFWTIFTHPLLDCCTTYGTQLFQPFVDYRVAFDNISVADPIYTVPFLLCVIIASFFSREKPIRQYINYAGIAISSLYMLFTFYNKYRVDTVFEKSLQEQGITYQRFMASPTIFNNILWQGVAEGDTAYYHSMYSLLDKEPRIKEFAVIPKNRTLLAPYENEESIKVLKWFTNGYYNAVVREDGQLQFNDLRFGSVGSSVKPEENFVFKFILVEEDGKIKIQQTRDIPEDVGGEFARLWERIKGE